MGALVGLVVIFSVVVGLLFAIARATRDFTRRSPMALSAPSRRLTADSDMHYRE